MRVLVSQLNRVPIKSSRPVGSHDGVRIPKSLREFIAEKNLERLDRPSYVDPMNSPLDAEYFQVPNTVRQPQMDFNRLTDGDHMIRVISEPIDWSGYEMDIGVPKKVARPSEELQLLSIQAQQQRLQILELQKQLHNLTVQQNQLKSLEEQKRQKQTEAVQESAVKDVKRTPRMHSEMEIVATHRLPPVRVSSQLNSHGSETMQAHTRSCNEKRTTTRSNDKVVLDAEQTHRSEKVSRHPRQSNPMDKSENSLRLKKQVRLNRRGGRGNVAAETGPVVRENADRCPYDKESKTFSCAECGKGFNQKFKLTNHLRVHSGEKPFKCRDCGAVFKQIGHLTTHQRIHSGVKPFKCLICNVAFRQKNNLSQHLLIHTNEKPFACDLCNELFREKSNLSDHMNIHSGRRPHKCNVCKKSFRQRWTLSRHRKVHD